MKLGSSSFVAVALLVGSSAAQAQGASAGWELSIRGERTRFGTYFERVTDTTEAPSPGFAHSVRIDRVSRLSIDPMNGGGATLSHPLAGGRWLLAVDGSYSKGQNATFVSIKDSFLGTSAYNSSEARSNSDASQWSAGLAVTRAFAVGARTHVDVAGGLGMTSLRISLLTGPRVPVPPSPGGYVSFPSEETHVFNSPSLSLGTTVVWDVWRHLALRAGVQGAVLRVNGDAVARSLSEQSGLSTVGGSQWRPATSISFGLGLRN